MKYFLYILIVLLLITTFVDLNIGYGYYQFLRWCVCVYSCIKAVQLYSSGKQLFILFAIIAVLFNPIAPIYLDKGLWKILDGVVAITIFLLRNK